MTRDFNEDVYKGKSSERPRKNDFSTTEQIPKTTGVKIPPTYDRSSKAICRDFATVEFIYKTTKVLKRGLGVGDHLVFLLDIWTGSVMGTRFRG